MKKESDNMSRIAGLLSYGAFWSESKKKIVGLYIGIVIICVFVLVLGVTMMTIEQLEKPTEGIAFFLIAIFSLIIPFSLLLILLLVFILKNEKKRKEVFMWLEDAIEINAFSKKIGSKYQLAIFEGAKIQVEFDIDGIHYIRESDSKCYKNKNFEGGYYYIWSKYADRQIKILYSPKYDEVMILKD